MTRSCNLLQAATHSRRPAGTTRGRLGWAAGWASWLQPSRRSSTGTSRWLSHLQNSSPPGGFHSKNNWVCAVPSSTAWSPVPPSLRTGAFQNKEWKARKKVASSSFVKTKERRLEPLRRSDTGSFLKATLRDMFAPSAFRHRRSHWSGAFCQGVGWAFAVVGEQTRNARMELSAPGKLTRFASLAG